MTEQKLRKCRACGKDIPADKSECPECGWDDEKAKQEIRKRRLLADVEKEMVEEEKKKGGGSSSKSRWGW